MCLEVLFLLISIVGKNDWTLFDETQEVKETDCQAVPTKSAGLEQTTTGGPSTEYQPMGSERMLRH